MRWFVTLVTTCMFVRITAAAPDVIDKPAAEKLFDEGRAELAAGHPDAACAKFELSIQKDPRAVGTLLNLGLCNERQGKVASALAVFVEAFDRATEQNDTALRSAAAEHVTALRPQVPIVAITYAASPLPGEKLLVDDRVVARDQHELPVDPGVHSVVLTAPDRLPYETTIAIKVATRTPLRLPALAVPGVATHPRRLAGKALTIGGLGVVVAAIAMGGYAYHEYHAQFGTSGHCGVQPPIDGDPVCDSTGLNHVNASRRWANAATLTGAVGVAVAAVGIGLWVTAPNETRLTPTASATSIGLAIDGRF